MSGKKSVYAVVHGRKPGLYASWGQCLLQVKGFPGNKHKGFGSEQEALQYLKDNGIQAAGLTPASATAEAAARAEGGATAAAPAAAAAPLRKRRAPGTGGRQLAAAAAASSSGGTARRGPLPATGRIFRLEFDGASKRNPGPAGFGAVLYDDATGVEVARMCQYMGDFHTNNQAEYAGLIAGLQAALDLGCQRIKVQGDSTLIIRQVSGEWRVKHEGLQPYHAAATHLKQRFGSFEARQVLREYNKAADALSNQAIDDYRSGVNRQLWTIREALALAAANDVAVVADELAAADETATAAAATDATAAAAAAAAAGEAAAGSEASGGERATAAAAAAADGEDSSGPKRKKRVRKAQRSSV